MSEIVERWRLECKEWLDLQSAADLLRETKNDVLSQIISRQDGKSHAEKDRRARCSADWHDFRNQMIDAEDKARRAKMRMKYHQMQFDAWRSHNANARQERSSY